MCRKYYTLSNGCYNPAGGDTYGMIRRAIDSGYTYFDTASLYNIQYQNSGEHVIGHWV